VIHDPNPLVVRRHEVYLRSAKGLLEVTESLLIENPLPQTYVGPAMDEAVQEEPVTLRLAIPSEFQKVTFEQESFGRSFALRDGQLVTGIPWEPGQRELKFTYVLHNAQQYRVWDRPLDLPTDAVQVRIATSSPDSVSGSLDRQNVVRRAGYSEVLFTSGPTRFPAGHVVRFELGQLPVPWTTHGKRAAAIALLLLIGGATLRRRRRTAQSQRAASHAASSLPDSGSGENRRPRIRRRLRGAA
jgi:hypothetical protein